MSHYDDIENVCYESDLKTHLASILEAELIAKEDRTVFGIVRQVLEQGRGSLSEKQEWVFKTKVYRPFCMLECGLCGENIDIADGWDVEQADLRAICFSCTHDISKRK